MKKGQTYTFVAITEFANKEGYSLEEHGKNVIGENFVVLKHDSKDITISFVLEGASSSAYMYECVYSDLK